MHIEQMGRISGSMKYRDERFDLAGMGPRDHSVGTRQWESMIWYDLAWVLMDDGRAFGLIQAQQEKGLVQIPWLWDGERLLPLSGMQFNKTLDGEDRPVSVNITACDPQGRQYHLTGTRRTSIPCFSIATWCTQLTSISSSTMARVESAPKNMVIGWARYTDESRRWWYGAREI